MADRFQVPPAHKDSLVYLNATDPQQLDQLVEALQKRPLAFDPDEFVPDFQKVLGKEYGPAVLAMTLSLSNSIQMRGLDVSRSLSEVGEVLAEPAEEDGSEFDLKRWPQTADRLKKLLELKQVKTLAKAVDLLYDQPNVLQSTRILTDVRPVFTTTDSSFESAVITQTLRIKYFESGEIRSLNIAIDEADIRQLIAACERAMSKSEAIRRALVPTGLTIGTAGQQVETD